MQFRRLGDSGLEVSVLCLGTMMFGDRTDAATGQRIIASAFDAGVNFIDPADVYHQYSQTGVRRPLNAFAACLRTADLIRRGTLTP